MRPKSIVVSDFVLAGDLVVLDRGYTARLERKIGSFPTHERKQRTVDRVNDEIVASVIATLREAGLAAQPGSEDTLTLKDEAVVVSGRLRAGEGGKAKPVGFGGGRGGVVADMTLVYFSAAGKRPLLSFSADAAAAGRPLKGKAAAARKAAIDTALAEETSAPAKLSPDVEAQARRIGRAVGDKIVAYAREQGWIAAPAVAETPAAQPPEPAEKPQANKPAT